MGAKASEPRESEPLTGIPTTAAPPPRRTPQEAQMRRTIDFMREEMRIVRRAYWAERTGRLCGQQLSIDGMQSLRNAADDAMKSAWWGDEAIT